MTDLRPYGAAGLPDPALPEVRLLEPPVFGDPRGFFVEVFHARRFLAGPSEEGRAPASGAIDGSPFVQINHSRSVKGTVRGLHFQEPRAQGKLVWVARGEVFDVAVDVRRGSPRFGRWTGATLSDQNHRQLWIPAGFAHGFCVLSEGADFLYACTEYYDPSCERAVRWDDPAIGVDWPVATPILSEKDRAAPLLEQAEVLPSYQAGG